MREAHRPDYGFIGLLTAVTAIGLVALTSASVNLGLTLHQDSWYFIRHQLLYGLLPGAVLFYVLSRVDYRRFREFAPQLLMLSVALLVTVFIPGLGAVYNGARSWLAIGTFSFQPAELVKLTFLLYVAAWMERHHDEFAHGSIEGIVPFLASFGVIAMLIMAQPDFGSLIVIAGITFGAYFAAGGRWTHIALLIALGIAGVFAAVKAAPYRAARLTTFLHPELDPKGVGYHINQAFLAIGSGGLFGLGLGHSIQKLRFLPEVAGDSIFAVMGEELGFVLMLAFVALLLAFCWRLMRIAQEAPDEYGRLIAVGVAAWVFCQTMFNIGSMVGILPITGLPLPFVSYGGSSLIVLLAAMGIMANISSHGRGARH
ncbi:MAG: hypothetical protein RLZZ324_614 [Candidatus Parcubacteria bacterium]|jgi:cell division protein FtsW